MTAADTVCLALKLALLAFVARCAIVYTYRLWIHPLHSYPGPVIAKLSDWYGAYHAFYRDLHRATYHDHKRYGRVIRQGPNKLVFNSVEALQDIYQNDRMLKSKSGLVTQVSPTTFNLFNVIDKRLHRIKRKIVGQGINERAMRQFEPVMQEQISIFLTKLAESSKLGKPVDMSERCCWLALDIAGELGFGHSFELQTDTKNRWMPLGLSTSNWRLNLYMQFPAIKYSGWEKLLLPYALPKVRRYHNMVTEMIKARTSQHQNAKPDLFSAVSSYKDPETGEGLNLKQLFQEATFLIPAGGDTTSSWLATTFFYLSTYPKVYERLAHEIRSTFTTAADIKGGPKLSGCTYLRAFLEETVRINPPVGTTLWRNLPADAGTNPVIIDGHHITPGTTVGVNIYSIHHNAEYFPDPFSFKPERWLPECSDPERLKIMHDAFTAFSMGYRGCAGKAMAYLETELVVAKALWYFDFERAGGDDSAVDEGSGPVFRTEDQFGSRHSGPRLVFRPRGGPVGELLAKEQS